MEVPIINLLTAEQCQQLLRQAISETLIYAEKTATAPEDRFLTRSEVAQILRISLPTLQRYTDLNLIRSKRVGNRVLYSYTEVMTSAQTIEANKHKRI
jgi:excisionase family DNA binding protein